MFAFKSRNKINSSFLMILATGLSLFFMITALVSCSSGGGGDSAPSYTIGGTVSGLAGSGLILQNNGGDDLEITANDDFIFETELDDEEGYAVTVSVQPSDPSQTCTVTNDSGTVDGADVTNVTVVCITNSYTVTFDSQSATVEANPTSKTVTSPATTVDALPTPPTKTSYTFGGWYTGTNGTGTEFTVSTTVTVSITVYAKWNLPVGALPKTGQTTSYATGDDGDLQRGIAWPSPRFTDNGDGTTTDNLTGLIWLKNANCFGTRAWANALSDANTLNSGECGLSDGSAEGDWRLPNRKELHNLVNYNEANAATWLNTQNFTNVQANSYWSSNTNASDTSLAWIVYMYSGDNDATNLKTTGYYVWPVRDGLTGVVGLSKTGQTTSYATGDDGDLEKGVAWPSPRFIDNGNGTTTDNLTGLIWLKNANCFGSPTWSNALINTSTLNSGECGLTDGSAEGDWRMPNVNELESLVNVSEANTSSWLNTQNFTNVQADYYWSSSTGVFNTIYAMVVRMGEGRVCGGVKSVNYYILPVRSGP